MRREINISSWAILRVVLHIESGNKSSRRHNLIAYLTSIVFLCYLYLLFNFTASYIVPPTWIDPLEGTGACLELYSVLGNPTLFGFPFQEVRRRFRNFTQFWVK